MTKDIDSECVALCEAINKAPGIQTISSCCGHGTSVYGIWFSVENLKSLPRLLYWFDSCHCGFNDWFVRVTTDCAMSSVHFCVENPHSNSKIYEQANKIADKIEEYLLKNGTHILTHEAHAQAEVDWYRKHGRYPNTRIVQDSHGVEYVIGDWSWNRKHGTCPTCNCPYCGPEYEVIEGIMKMAII